ncbi:hypothetical protein F4X86_04035 [Candidatus Saccharibacteria bacterium]|nr:hypothetical protein [Candidatus Saccharibacteria bacterium]
MRRERKLLHVNPRMPRPCSQSDEALRVEALNKWGDQSLSRDEIMRWFAEGAPSKNGFMMSAASSKDPVPGQGRIPAGKLVDRLISAKIFLWRGAL